MKHLAIVRQDAPDRWTARSAALPGFEATGATEAAALDALRRDLAASLAGGRLVEIEVPVDRAAGLNGSGPATPDVPVTPEAAAANPWLKHFGFNKDDPHFDEYLEEIRRFREEQDALWRNT